MKSKSRNVNGYVKAVRARDALAAKLGDIIIAFEDRTGPLRRKLDLARTEVGQRRLHLTGGQMSEAERMLRAEVGS